MRWILESYIPSLYKWLRVYLKCFDIDVYTVVVWREVLPSSAENILAT